MAKQSFLSRRQFLKVSAQVTAGFGALWHFISSSAIADDEVPRSTTTTDPQVVLRPVMDPAQFPNQLSFTDSLPSVRDQTRMLLFFPKPLHSTDVAQLLNPTGLVLEDDAMGSELSLAHYRVNHGDRRFWVRSKNGEPIDRTMLKTLDEITTGHLERIGPVYRVPRSTEQSGLYCPLPHVLVVKPQTQIDENDFVEFFSSFNLQEIPAISTYLMGYRYLMLIAEHNPTVYDLYGRFLDHDAHIVQQVLFDLMPLVSPLASSHSPNDYYYRDVPKQWNMDRIAAGGTAGSSGWELSKGNGIIVAVVDNGCDITHPDIAFTPTSTLTTSSTNSGATFDFPSPLPGTTDFPSCASPTSLCAIDGGACIPGDSSFANTHGTKMAGIIGSTHNNMGIAGVAGECLIMSLRSSTRSISERAAAINYAAQHGAKVINCSWAEEQYIFDLEPYRSWKNPVNAILKSAGEQAVICAASGNKPSSQGIGYPASEDQFVIACGGSSVAMPHEERWTVSPTEGSQYGAGLSVVAPGENIVSTTVQDTGNLTGPGTTRDYRDNLSGTSYATAHVSGLAAMLMSRFPSLTAQEVRRVIERTADKVNPMTYPYSYQPETFPVSSQPTRGLRYPSGPWNNQVGYGRINCYDALTFSDVYIKDYPTDSGDEPSSPPPDQNFWSTSGIVIRPTDDGIFQPEDPLQSSLVQLGQDNVVYVQVINRGPAQTSSFTVHARLVRYNMTEFRQADWTGPIAPGDSEHIQLTPLAATFSNVPKGDKRLAKFRLEETHVTLFGSQMWHPCILAHVECATDYANLKHKSFAIDSPEVLWLNNLAQRNVTITPAPAGAVVPFSFLTGNPGPRSGIGHREIEILIERKLLPEDFFVRPSPTPHRFPRTPFRLSLDVDRSVFSPVKSLMPLDATSGRLSALGTRMNQRTFEFHGTKEIFRAVTTGTGPFALLLETEVPKGARPGQFFQTDISQRNRQGQVVGGVTVIYHIVE